VQAVVGLLLRDRHTRGTHSSVAPPHERAPTLIPIRQARLPVTAVDHEGAEGK